MPVEVKQKLHKICSNQSGTLLQLSITQYVSWFPRACDASCLLIWFLARRLPEQRVRNESLWNFH